MKQVSLPLRRSLCISLALPWIGSPARAEGHSKEEAIKMVEKAIAMHKAVGKEKTLAAVNQKDGPFVEGEVYLFVYDITGMMVAHAVNPKLVGRNLLEVPDPDGKYWRKTIRDVAVTKGSGWVDYKYKNPVTGRNEPKSSYVHKMDDVIYCCGIYL